MAASVGGLSVKLALQSQEFTKGLSTSVNQSKNWGREMKRVYEQVMTPMERYQRELTKLNMMKQTGLDHTAHARAVEQLKQKYGLLATQVQRTSIAMRAMKMAQTGAGMLGLGVGSAAIGYGAKQAFTMAHDVQKGMQSSLAIMSNVSDEMRAMMQDTAHAIAYDTQFSAAEGAKAYYYLASAGLDAAQSMEALPVVAKFAQAGMFDLSRATDLLTDAQMAMGLSSKDAATNMQEMTHVADVLVKANTIANASVEQFSEALTNKAAGAARRFNQEIEEVTAVLAAFASRGIKGVEAGTQYDILLRELAIKAKENAAAFKKMNVSVYDSVGNMRFVGDIIADLESALQGMSDSAKVATLMQLGFTSKTLSTTSALMGASDEIKSYERALRDAAGTMDGVADVQMTKFESGWNRLKASMEEFASVHLTDDLDRIGGSLELLTGKFDRANETGWSFVDLMGQLTGANMLLPDAQPTPAARNGNGGIADLTGMSASDASRAFWGLLAGETATPDASGLQNAADEATRLAEQMEYTAEHAKEFNDAMQAYRMKQMADEAERQAKAEREAAQSLREKERYQAKAAALLDKHNRRGMSDQDWVNSTTRNLAAGGNIDLLGSYERAAALVAGAAGTARQSVATGMQYGSSEAYSAYAASLATGGKEDEQTDLQRTANTLLDQIVKELQKVREQFADQAFDTEMGPQ